MIADRASAREASTAGSRPTFTELAKNCFAGTLDDAAHLVVTRAHEGEGGYVSLCNVHLLTLARRDRWVHEVLSGAWMRFADGAPVAWLQRRLGRPTAERVGGPDLMARVLELGRDAHIRHFFLGSTPAVLDSLERRVQTAFPGTEICGSFSPPFGPMEADAVETMLDAVRASRADIVWVGLGAPKQDLWMKRFTGEFPSTVACRSRSRIRIRRRSKAARSALDEKQRAGVAASAREGAETVVRKVPQYEHRVRDADASRAFEKKVDLMSLGENSLSAEERRVASLISDRLTILHDGRRADGRATPGDVDCAAMSIDPFWPLRLPHGWTLCQSLHYDVRAWYWVLERDGRVLCLDTLDDRRGLGRDGLSSTLAFRGNGDPAPGPAAAPAGIVAAYLTLKRIRKQIRSRDEWERIALLATDDPELFEHTLAAVLGASTASLLAEAVISGDGPPPEALWRRARRQQQLRRFGTPGRALLLAWLGARRFIGRLARPTGLAVVVAGPDGAGKTTLASGLVDEAGTLFRRTRRRHWRAGVLPRPGALLGRSPGDSTHPHAQSSHGGFLSVVLLLYFWLDFVVGHLLHDGPFRARTGFLVIERGWWDLAVDPARYRLRPPQFLVSALGRLLPRPDLTIVLIGSESGIHERKQELSREELHRQQEKWKTVLPAGQPTVVLDADRPEGEVLRDARRRVVTLLEERSVARLGAGWAALPTRARPRWLLPRGPRSVARAALDVYHPQTTKGRLGWECARAFASLGGFYVLPRGGAPPKRVRDSLASYLPARSTYALASANHAGRFMALILREDGRPYAFAKVATDDTGRAALRREADALESYGRLLRAPLSAPTILAREEGVLLLEPVRCHPRNRSHLIPAEVAHALGVFYRETRTECGGEGGVSHGDFAPWNLLRTSAGWLLIDWEAAQTGTPPYFDLFHYFVQAHWLLGKPRERALFEGFGGRGAIGAAINAYANGAGLDSAGAARYFEEYLLAAPEVARATAFGSDGIQIRQQLLRRFAEE